MTGDFVVIDIEPLEQCLVESPAGFVAGVAVQRFGIGQQLEAGVDESSTFDECVVDVSLLSTQPFALLLDLAQPGADLALGEFAVGGEVEQVLFLHGSLVVCRDKTCRSNATFQLLPSGDT